MPRPPQRPRPLDGRPRWAALGVARWRRLGRSSRLRRHSNPQASVGIVFSSLLLVGSIMLLGSHLPVGDSRLVPDHAQVSSISCPAPCERPGRTTLGRHHRPISPPPRVRTTAPSPFVLMGSAPALERTHPQLGRPHNRVLDALRQHRALPGSPRARGRSRDGLRAEDARRYLGDRVSARAREPNGRHPHPGLPARRLSRGHQVQVCGRAPAPAQATVLEQARRRRRPSDPAPALNEEHQQVSHASAPCRERFTEWTEFFSRTRSRRPRLALATRTSDPRLPRP